MHMFSMPMWLLCLCRLFVGYFAGLTGSWVVSTSFNMYWWISSHLQLYACRFECLAMGISPCPLNVSAQFPTLSITSLSRLAFPTSTCSPGSVQAKTCWKHTKCCWAAQIRSRLESSVSNWRGETLDSTGYVHFWVNKCKQQVKETSQGHI